MASYKSAIRTPAPTTEQPESKFKEKARQLQEFFPSWSQDDLQSLLTEVNGDVEVAATRISDGKAEQWGSVSRKKDKKLAHAPKESVSSTPSFRGDFRGGRGGARGGRGGSARGGAAVRGARGEFRGGRGGHLNGHTPRTSSPAVGQNPDNKASDASKPISDNAVSDSTPETWNEVSNPEENSSLGVGIAGDSTSAWSAPTNTNAWGATDTASDHSSAQANANVNGSTPTTTSHAPAPTTAKPFFKSLATSKLSWAQVARPQDKTTPSTPAPIGQQQQQQQSLRPAPEPIPSANAPSLSTRTSAPPEPEPSVNTGWEDPTTVQTPSFDEEPSIPTVSSEPAKVELEPEAAHQPTPSKPTETVAVEAPPSVTPSTPAPSTPAPSTPSKVAARPAAVAQRHSARYSNYAKIASDQGGVVMPPTPSSIGTNLSGLSSFGTFGDFKSNVDKVGMQFGSLSLGGASEPESEPEAASAPLPVSTTEASAQTPASAPEATAPSTSASLNSGLYQPQPQPLQASVSQPAVSSSPSIPTVAASSVQSLQQQSASTQPHSQSQSLSQLPQQLQQQTTQQTHHHYVQHGLPTHVEPSSQSQNQTQSPPQQVPQTQQQHYLRQNDQSPYGSVVTNNVSSGFSHSPTPPQDNNGYGAFGSGLGSQGLGGQGLGLTSQALGGMGQAALGGVAGLGGMGGLGQGLGHQQQQSVSTFDSYGYEGGQRSFYESYQPNAFGGRSVLGHDDLKAGMPSQQQAQQAPSTASTGSSSNNLPSSSSQSSVPQSQQSPATSVSSPQGQPQPGQGPAPTGYHPAAPVPTYYYQPFPQNSYYGAATMGAPSNYGYGVGGMGVPQPYPGINVGKYPTMYPGPPGNAPSPAGKPSPGMGVVNHGHGSVIGHGGLGVQPQNYAAGLYGQQQGYDDYSHHSQPQHHQQQGHQHHTSHGLGLGQDYSKQLYGAQGGLQGYMSGAGAGSAATGAGPRGGQSPETAYKPYAPKDVGVGRGNVQQGQGQGQGQSQGQAQGQGQGGGPQGQGFYAGNRFGGGGNVGGGPQQSAHSAPLYPQGQNDAGYYYQQRQQQYWQ